MGDISNNVCTGVATRPRRVISLIRGCSGSACWKLSATSAIGSLTPAFLAVLLWNFVGVLNMESALHIEYSLGSSSGWHSWFDRGAPGEVIRHLGVPVYDQWSGLGYRLPTQGFLVDTPLSYLALVLPINSVMFIGMVASLWFAFALSHRWVSAWTSRYRLLCCVVFDAGVLGIASFYTLWHGWQFLVIQIAGAVVCLVTITGRQVLECPERVPLGALMTKMSLGMLMVMTPHLGNGMTFAPAIIALLLVVMFSGRMTLVRRIMKRPIVLVAPMTALLVLLPAVLDLRRELQLQDGLPPYEPEFGFLNMAIPSGDLNPTQFLSWAVSAAPVLHYFFFPIVGLFSPSTYLWSALPYPLTLTLDVHLWSHDRAQFGGGFLAVVLIALVSRRPTSRTTLGLERTIGTLAAVATFISLFNIEHPYATFLAFRWVPVWLLNNSRWQYADLALILVLLLLVLRAEDLGELCMRRSSILRIRVLLLRIGTISGLVSVLALLPYRVVEPLRLNHGQTRFAPLQTDSVTRLQNERWKTQIESLVKTAEVMNPVGAERVVISDLIEPEGEREWFGLRSTIQLRDVGVASVLTASRIRSGQTLSPPRVRLRSNAFDVECEREQLFQSLHAQLDLLAVSWSILPSKCWASSTAGLSGTHLESSPQWMSIKSSRTPESVMRQLLTESARGNFRIVRSEVFHHWWSQAQTSIPDVCSLLSEPCLERLNLSAGKQLPHAPLTICRKRCVATYELVEVPPSTGSLVVPLNYDSALRAVQGGETLEIYNLHGLTGIDSRHLEIGQVMFYVKTDYIMNLRAAAPLAVLALIVAALAVSWKARRSHLVNPEIRETLD